MSRLPRGMKRLPSGVLAPKRTNVKEWLTEHGIQQEALIEDDLPPMGSAAERRKLFIEQQCDLTRRIFNEITNEDGTATNATPQFIVVANEALMAMAESARDPESFAIMLRLADTFDDKMEHIPASVFLSGVFRLIVAFGKAAARYVRAALRSA